MSQDRPCQHGSIDIDTSLANTSGIGYCINCFVRTYNVKTGDTQIYLHHVPDDGPPTSHSRIVATAAQAQCTALKFPLSTYPRADPRNDEVVQAALDNSYLETWEIIHAHKPNIVNYEFNPMEIVLTESCRGSDGLIPNFLLGHGADPNAG